MHSEKTFIRLFPFSCFQCLSQLNSKWCFTGQPSSISKTGRTTHSTRATNRMISRFSGSGNGYKNRINKSWETYCIMSQAQPASQFWGSSIFKVTETKWSSLWLKGRNSTIPILTRKVTHALTGFTCLLIRTKMSFLRSLTTSLQMNSLTLD